MFNPYHILDVKDYLVVHNVPHIGRVIVTVSFKIKISATNDQGQRLDGLYLAEAIPVKTLDRVGELFNLGHCQPLMREHS